jgi:hypothetical protein
MRKLTLRSLAAAIFFVSAPGLLAISALLPTIVFAAPHQQARCAATDVACVIAAGDVLITNRQNSLNTLSSKVSADLSAHKITSDQASVLRADITTNRTGLSNLKSKLDAETNARAARQDITTIFLQFRIYAVVLPRDYRRIQMDVEINVKSLMGSVAARIKQAISAAPANEQARLNALFSDYQKQVTAAESQLDIAQRDFPAMTPENFNQNRLSYQATKTALDNALRAARVDLHQAAKDLGEMARVLGIKK